MTLHSCNISWLLPSLFHCYPYVLLSILCILALLFFFLVLVFKYQKYRSRSSTLTSPAHVLHIFNFSKLLCGTLAALPLTLPDFINHNPGFCDRSEFKHFNYIIEDISDFTVCWAPVITKIIPHNRNN